MQSFPDFLRTTLSTLRNNLAGHFTINTIYWKISPLLLFILLFTVALGYRGPSIRVLYMYFVWFVSVLCEMSSLAVVSTYPSSPDSVAKLRLMYTLCTVLSLRYCTYMTSSTCSCENNIVLTSLFEDITNHLHSLNSVKDPSVNGPWTIQKTSKKLHPLPPWTFFVSCPTKHSIYFLGEALRLGSQKQKVIYSRSTIIDLHLAFFQLKSIFRRTKT